jgi:DHA1 family bicyclomycin/chloramphenicol resistance-like MFS transporter
VIPELSPDGAVPQVGPRRATGTGLVVVIGSLILLPAVTTDMYLPSLPDVARDLDSTIAAAQFTITGMLIGGGLGQLVVGPFSDRVGRRLPALIGISAHLVISLLCTAVTTITQLAGLRVLQGVAVAGGTVVALAVVRDRYTGAQAARLLSRLMLVIGAAPLLAPTVGGLVAERWGWRAVFLTLAVLALVIGLVVFRFLPETLPPQRRVSRGLGTVFRGYGQLLRDGHFMALALLPGLGMGVVMGYVAGSSFVFQNQYDLSKPQFALVFAVIGISQVAVAQLNAGVVPRVGPLRMLRFGLPLAVGLAGVLVTVAATATGGLTGLVVMLWLTMGSLGLIMANASALALSRHGERAGSAAAVVGFLQAGLGGAIGTLVGVIGGHATSMAAVMLGSLTVGLLVLALATPAYHRGGWLTVMEPFGGRRR